MNQQQVGLLLALASGFDNRKPSELQTAAWFEALRHVEFEEAKTVVIAHYTGESHRDYLTVGIVLDKVRELGRTNLKQVVVDVRAAKARGLLAKTWPSSEPLPRDVSVALAAMREQDRITASRYEVFELGEGVSEEWGILE